MLRIAPLALLLLAAARVLAADNETARLLGPEAEWANARIFLEDVHGGIGGDEVAVSGSGEACVRIVDRLMNERRYALTLSKEDTLGLFKLAVEKDVLGAKPRASAVKKTEVRSEVALVSSSGLRRSVLRWSTDEVASLAAVEAALRSLEKECAGAAPIYSGRFVAFFKPLPSVHVNVLLSYGRPDPTFELVRPEEWEKLRSFTVGVAKTTRPGDRPPPRGYRGFSVLPQNIPELPRSMTVWNGTLRLNDSPANPTFFKDEKGLEAWLKEAARERGIDVAK